MPPGKVQGERRGRAAVEALVFRERGRLGAEEYFRGRRRGEPGF